MSTPAGVAPAALIMLRVTLVVIQQETNKGDNNTQIYARETHTHTQHTYISKSF